jgi:hypothetical protein
MKTAVAAFLVFSTVRAIAADAPSTFTVGGFKFQRPEKWEWVEVTSSMRKAQLRVKREGSGEAADVVFFYFGPGQGGDAGSNVRRWISQFKGGSSEAGSNVETRKINGTNVSFVRHEGTFMSGMPGGPTKPVPGYALAGAIIESPNGNVFVKMTGPAAAVKEATPAFEKMVTDAVAAAKQ